METHNFKELKVWQFSMNLVKEIYLITQDFPNEEKFGITSQIRRCVISVPSNIAEGAGRGSNKDFARFLSIALSSAYELETQIILSKDLEFITEESFNKLISRIHEVQKMLFVFQKKMGGNSFLANLVVLIASFF